MLGTGGSGEYQAESSHLWSPEPSRWLGLRTVMYETSVDRGMPCAGGDIGSRALSCESG